MKVNTTRIDDNITGIATDWRDDVEKEKQKQTFIYLSDCGTTINLSAIKQINKTELFSNSKARYVYGIIINKNTSLQGDKAIYIWYECSKVRDEKYDLILIELSNLGNKVITI